MGPVYDRRVMKPVTAMRAGRSLFPVTLISTLALILAAASIEPPGAAAGGGRPAAAQSADACGGGATLALSDRHPLQMHPVRFSAAASSVPAASVSFYDFNYGDGSDDATAEATAVHAYQAPGTYLATVSLVTNCNTIVTSAAYHVVVADGLPPDVTIIYPLADHVTHFGRAGLLLRGTASDPSGVRKVELAIQILSVARSAAAAAKPGCYWYDGHSKLRLRGCTTPLYFAAKVHGTQWSFRMNPRSQIPPGVYAVRVRATDRVGNITTIFSTKVGNILGFKLVA